MRFSVLVSIYNARDFLEARVRSVLRQTERDFELVLADDGSTDGSGEACDRFAAQNPEIVRVAHQPNKGLILTRRTGTQMARGARQKSAVLDGDWMQYAQPCLEKGGIEPLNWLKKVQLYAILNKKKSLLDTLGFFGRLQRRAKYGA